MLLLLEDFELMNKYPWGSFLWTKLYNSLHHVLVPYKERVVDKTRKGVMTYHLSGFTWAFKMWIWEAYKNRIEAYAFKSESEGIPRGIHWKRKKKVMGWNEYVELMQLPDDIPDEERPLNRLRPTKTEVKCEWWVASVNYFKNPDAKVPVKKVDDPKKFDDETKKELTDMIKNLIKRLDDHENKHAKEIKEMSDRVEAGIRVTHETLKIVHSLYVSRGVHRTSILKLHSMIQNLQQHIRQQEQDDGGFIGGYVSDVEVQTTKKDMFDNVKVASPVYVRRSKRDRRVARARMSPFVTPSQMIKKGAKRKPDMPAKEIPIKQQKTGRLSAPVVPDNVILEIIDDLIHKSGLIYPGPSTLYDDERNLDGPKTPE
ncbi:uncharacterized protein [Rutidosis leptorrhynchoides]|uniref:uncharacterized protein n=1 Tax=Rutidosis leptorrhynchoides TaxID=125765 RepID=UPI003A991187